MTSEYFRCDDCKAEVQWLTPKAGSVKAEVSVSAVRRWVKEGSVHAWQLPNGHIRICSKSLSQSQHRRQKQTETEGDRIAAGPASSSSANDERIRKAIEYVQGHATEKLTVEQVARVASLSVSRFEELFKKEVGTGLKQYQRTLRAREAEPLLADPNLNMTDVANRLGYVESGHFSRDFKRATGQTPRDYRKKLLSR